MDKTFLDFLTSRGIGAQFIETKPLLKRHPDAEHALGLVLAVYEGMEKRGLECEIDTHVPESYVISHRPITIQSLASMYLTHFTNGAVTEAFVREFGERRHVKPVNESVPRRMRRARRIAPSVGAWELILINTYPPAGEVKNDEEVKWVHTFLWNVEGGYFVTSSFITTIKK